MASPRPLAWDWLVRLSPGQEVLLARASSWLPAGASRSLEQLAPALGQALEIRAGEVSPARALPHPDDPAPLVVLEHLDRGPSAVVAIDAPLALDLVWLSLAEDLDPSLATPRPLDRVEQGVLLYLAARAVWAIWGQDGPLRVARLARAGELDELLHGAVTVHLNLRAGPCAGHAWLYLPPSLSRLLPPATGRSPQRGAWLDDIPAMVHVAVGRAEIALSQLFDIREGDLLVLDESWPEPSGAEGLTGPVRLRLSRGRPRWLAELSDDGTVSVGDTIDPAKERAVTDPSDDSIPSNPGELLREIPAELSVEVGRIPLTAREAVELRAGQTLRLDRRPGDPVELRIGPKLVARGELVEVDGELGVLLREIYGS